MNASPTVVLAGGSGFLGQALSRHFRRLGHAVTVLRRGAIREAVDAHGVRHLSWDGETPGPWTGALEGAWAVINLAGRTVDCRYTKRNRALILDSRVRSTRALGRAVAQCQNPPRVWLNSSTATLYRHSLDRPMDEATGEIGATPEACDTFSVEVALAWEHALNETATPATRRVSLRTAMVLGLGPNSVFPVLTRLVRLGLGGRMGHGRQFVSWIHEEDFCRAVHFLIEHEPLSGPVNVTAPHPVTNAEMMRLFRQQRGARFGLPAHRWMLEVGAFLLRTETELILKSRRVIPRRLLEAGFTFRYPVMSEAIAHLDSLAKRHS